MLNGQDVLCVYQSNNIDSVVAAWVMWKQFPNASFIPHLAEVQPSDLQNRNVFILGASIPVAYLVDMAPFCQSLTIFSFETTYGMEIDQLAGEVPANVQFVYKPHLCLATMVWRYFNGPAHMPSILSYIEDRVQWRYYYPETRPVVTALGTLPPVFERWDRVISQPNIQALVEEGRILLRGLSRDIDFAIANSQRRVNIAGYNVPVINTTPMLSSAAGIQMAKGEPFAACYWDTAHGREYALISGPQGVDISELVRGLGGHGTRFEAHFKVPKTHPLAMV